MATADIETLAAATRVFAEGVAPATPSAGEVVAYAKTDGKLYSKDDAGTETGLGGGSIWTADIDDPLTALTNITTGSGSWSIDTYLKCAVTTNTHCRAYVDSPLMSHANVAVVEAEFEIPTLLTGASDFIDIGWIVPGDVSTSTPGHVICGLIGDGRIYAARDGLGGATRTYTIPAAGTWVKLRLMRVGGQVSFWIDGVLEFEATLDVADLDANPGYQPGVHFYSDAAMTARVRNLKAWSLEVPA